MKRLLTILLLFCAFRCVASLNVTNGDVVTYNNASYSTGGHYSGVTFLSLLPCMYPTITNEFYDVSRSGENWGGWWQNEEEKWTLPAWVSHTNLQAQVKNYYFADDNGGLTTNTCVQYGTNIANAPQLFYNGTAVTNEGYNFPIQFYWPGAYPHDSVDGDSGEIDRNNGCLGLEALYGYPLVDLWHMTWTNGWNTDVVGSRYLGFSTGSHPHQGGFTAGAISAWTALGAETNVGTCTIDYANLLSITNHFATSAITNTGVGVSFIIKADRMPMGWIQVGTNNGFDCFKAIPQFANWFTWTINGTNFPNGGYNVKLDGISLGTVTVSSGTFSMNLFTNMSGAWWNQRQEVIGRLLDLEGADRTTLLPHSAGQGGTLGVADMVNWISNANNFYDTLGQRGSTLVTSMASDTAAIEQYDAAIYVAAQQTNHLMTITSAFIPVPFRH